MRQIFNRMATKVMLIFMLGISPFANGSTDNEYEQRLETTVELTREQQVEYLTSQTKLDKSFVMNLQKLDSKLFCLAQNNFFEARGESMVGKVAVAAVVVNRAEHESYPSDVCAVVKQSTSVRTFDTASDTPIVSRVCQFSWYCAGKGVIPLRDNRGNVDPRVYKEWHDSVVAAMLVYTGKLRDIVGKATHFYDNTSVKPLWSRNKNFTKVEVIGNHTFMAPKDR